MIQKIKRMIEISRPLLAFDHWPHFYRFSRGLELSLLKVLSRKIFFWSFCHQLAAAVLWVSWQNIKGYNDSGISSSVGNWTKPELDPDVEGGPCWGLGRWECLNTKLLVSDLVRKDKQNIATFGIVMHSYSWMINFALCLELTLPIVFRLALNFLWSNFWLSFLASQDSLKSDVRFSQLSSAVVAICVIFDSPQLMIQSW